eukprot:2363418-Rhodomonas_salina.2
MFGTGMPCPYRPTRTRYAAAGPDRDCATRVAGRATRALRDVRYCARCPVLTWAALHPKPQTPNQGNASGRIRACPTWR